MDFGTRVRPALPPPIRSLPDIRQEQASCRWRHNVLGLQVAAEIGERAHAVASIGWAFSSDKAGDDVHVSQYDLGLEVFQTFHLGEQWMLRPFLGAGAGGRTYIFDDSDADSQNDLAGYATLGTEFQIHRMALRLAGRGYLTRFEGLHGNGKHVTRGDLALSAGLAYHFR
jgi:hypothetical protein